MSQHTPGPWASLGPTIYDRAIIKAGDYEVATQIAVTYGRKSNDEHDANTRLIAAAPDLLEALREMYHAFLDPDHIVTDRQEAASLGAYRAIYKATGKTT